MRHSILLRSFGAVLLAAVTAQLLTGCGAGQSTSSSTGSASLTVRWPSRSRLIPEASNSIRIDFTNTTGVVASRVIARPQSGNQTNVTVDLLPLGDLTVKATAYPESDGTGVAQATAAQALTIQAGQITPFSLSMASTIDHLEVTPIGLSIAPGQAVQLVGTAKDSSGATVLMAPSKLQWTSSDTSVAIVDGTGLVTGVATGAANATITDSESGKSASATIAVSSAGGTVTQYTVTDLGVLNSSAPDPSDYSEATAVNANGQIVGATIFAGTARAYRWQSGQMTDLGVLGSADSYAYGINDAGQVVGTSNLDAFVWQNGQMTDLGSPGGYYTAAYGINGSGQIVGTSYDPGGGVRAYLWQSGQATDLGTLGGANAIGNGINSVGQIVGGAETGQTQPNTLPVEHAFLWQNGQMTDLGTLGSYQSEAWAINANGQIVGQVFDDSSYAHGFIWQNGQMSDLGTLSADLSSILPLSINGSGLVVGTASSQTDSRAFLWKNGVMSDLNDLIPSDSGWTLTEAHGINDNGQIVGNGMVNGTPHAFLLTPSSRAAGIRTRAARPTTHVRQRIHPAMRTYHSRFRGHYMPIGPPTLRKRI